MGPTASGKSSLSLKLAHELEGIVVNADALQVYDNWQVLTARPSLIDIQAESHELYGQIGYRESYSVGTWLRDIKPLLELERPLIIVGGTGLYFTSLFDGLADIPETPDTIRHEGNSIRENNRNAFLSYLMDHDPKILISIDKNNPMRLQRAWEVHRSTGKALSAWQAETPAPMLADEHALKLVLECDTKWLNEQIDARLDQMVGEGALDECRKNLGDWDPARPSSRALGASELIASLRGEIPLSDAIERAKTATHQFAKRQRTWIRSKMSDWEKINAENPPSAKEIISLFSIS